MKLGWMAFKNVFQTKQFYHSMILCKTRHLLCKLTDKQYSQNQTSLSVHFTSVTVLETDGRVACQWELLWAPSQPYCQPTEVIICFYSHLQCAANLTAQFAPQCSGITWFIRKTPSRTCLFLQLKISQSTTSEMAPSSGSAAPIAKHTYLAITAAPTELKTAGNSVAKQIGWLTDA